jgi:hypothetical protein
MQEELLLWRQERRSGHAHASQEPASGNALAVGLTSCRGIPGSWQATRLTCRSAGWLTRADQSDSVNELCQRHRSVT